jgi:hypothetical protein
MDEQSSRLVASIREIFELRDEAIKMMADQVVQLQSRVLELEKAVTALQAGAHKLFEE